MVSTEETYSPSTLEVHLATTASNYKRTLIGVEEIKSFFSQESEYWQSGIKQARPDLARGPVGMYRQAADRVLGLIRNLEEADENKDQDAILSQIKVAAESKLLSDTTYPMLFSEMSITAELMSMLTSGDVRAHGAAAYFGHPDHRLLQLESRAGKDAVRYYIRTAVLLNQDVIEETDPAYAEGQLIALNTQFEREIKSLIVTKEEAAAAAQKIIDEYGRTAAQIEEDKAKIIDEFERSFSAQLTGAGEELEKIRQTYEEHTHLQGPSRYWGEVAINYETRGKRWTHWLIGTIGFSVLVLTFLLYVPSEYFSKSLFNGDPGAIKGLLLFASIISFLAYLTRLMARLSMSAHHLQRDAQERRVLTTYYLSLIRHGAMDEKDRPIILQALFSRSDSGLLRGSDHSPASVSASALLEQLLRK